MTREPHYIDLTADYVSREERLRGLLDGSIKDPHLQKLDNVAWWMVAVLMIGWVIAVL